MTNCTNCRIGFSEQGKPIYAKLEQRGDFMRCVECGASYGPAARLPSDETRPATQAARDTLGRLVDPTAMPEHVKDTVATCYGLLWAVHTTDTRIHRARRGLLQWLTKDEQARGIDMARGVMLMTENRELVDPSSFLEGDGA